MNRRKRRSDARFATAVVGFALAFLIAIVPQSTTFHFDGTVERLHIVLDGNRPSWFFPRAELSADESTSHFSGVFRPAAHSDVLIERISTGDMKIRFRVAGSPVVGEWASEMPKELRASRVVLVADVGSSAWPRGATMSLPFSGRLDLGTGGAVSEDAATPVVRSGRLRLIGRGLFNDSFYDAGAVELSLGDSLEVPSPQGSTVGLVIIDERPAMAVTFGGVGTSAVVRRFRSAGFRIGVSLPDKIRGDGGVQALIALYGFVSAAIYWFSGRSSNK